MRKSPSHDRAAETPDAKARWFQSLPLQERMQLLCDFTDLFLEVNPKVADRKNAEQAQEGVRILRIP